jgi:flagellar motor protein MotB
MQLVEDELKIDFDMSSSDLFEKAKAVFPAVDKLTIRQFHARYPLQIKRRIAMEGTGAGKKSSGGKKSATARAGGRKAAAKKAPAKAAKKAPAKAAKKATSKAAKKATKKAATKRAATKKAATKRTRSAAVSAPTEGRDQVRQVLLQFAGDLSAADERKDVVKVLAGIDGYVNDVMRAVS